MVSRITFFGVFVACVASLGSLAFFLLFVNPDYIGISGFAFFYASVWVALWSSFFLIGLRIIHRRRVRASLRHALIRRSGLSAACITGCIVLAQLGALTWYAIALLVCAAIIIDHRLERK